MKIFKFLFLILVILAAVFFTVPYFLADSIVMVESKEMRAKPATVFRQVHILKNWHNWSPFEDDPTMVNTYEGPEQGVGAKRIWNGEKAGQGSMTIIKSDPYEYIQNQLSFGPDGGGGVGSWNFDKTESGLTVTWTIHVQDLSYPIGKWMGLLIKNNMEPLMAQGLQDLKSYAESLPDPPEIKIIQFEGHPAAVISDSVTIDQFDGLLEHNFNELRKYLKRYQVPITGQQFAIYHNWNPAGITYITSGIPVEHKRKGNTKIKYTDLPSCKAVFAQHKGGPNSASTHIAIHDYLKDFNLEREDYIWETYLYDPVVDTDTTKWVTFIYYPLK